MRYADYDKMIYTDEDLLRRVAYFEKDIANKQKELSEFIKRANDRVSWIKECEENKKYCIIGRTYKDGRDKGILLILRFEDGTQRDERYSYNKIGDMKIKLAELKEKYSGVDWSMFDEEI